MSSEGVVTILFGHNLIVPLPAELPEWIRRITYNYAFDVTLEADGLIIRGEPYIAPEFASTRMLQATYANSTFDFQVYNDQFNEEVERVNT